MSSTAPSSEPFEFRRLHPLLYLGTASDRYAGWLGQIYSPQRYADLVKRRSKTLGKQTFVEEVLPVNSVEEYFEHFRVLELDFTFYRPLLDENGEPTPSLRALEAYGRHLRADDGVLLKVPQAVFAKKLLQAGRFRENPVYLDPELFTRRFLQPALEILGSGLQGMIFEQEYHRKQDRLAPRALADELRSFFSAIPRDARYHVELRTSAYLSAPVLRVFEEFGIGQVLSHWTWLPPLKRQFLLGGKRFLNAGGAFVIRLMTPRGLRYEEAYARAHPFSALVEGMLNPQMIRETVDLVRQGILAGVRANVIVNNRAGGNAPLIAREIAAYFLEEVPR